MGWRLILLPSSLQGHIPECRDQTARSGVAVAFPGEALSNLPDQILPKIVRLAVLLGGPAVGVCAVLTPDVVFG